MKTIISHTLKLVMSEWQNAMLRLWLATFNGHWVINIIDFQFSIHKKTAKHPKQLWCIITATNSKNCCRNSIIHNSICYINHHSSLIIPNNVTQKYCLMWISCVTLSIEQHLHVTWLKICLRQKKRCVLQPLNLLTKKYTSESHHHPPCTALCLMPATWRITCLRDCSQYRKGQMLQ